MLRDHEGVTLRQFNGLFRRGDSEDVPPDHFDDCENIRFVGTSGFATRYGIARHQNVAVPLGNVVRLYNYITREGNTLLVLTYDGTTGKIYHVIDSTTIYGPILSIAGMEDFGFVPYAGRAYITPFAVQQPLLGGPTTAPLAVRSAAASGVNVGIHKYAITYTDASGETVPSPLVTINVFDEAAVPTPLQPTLTSLPGGTHNLTVGATVKWKLSYLLSSGIETLPGAASADYVVPTNTNAIGLQGDGTFPDNFETLYIYRTVADGSVYYRETSVSGDSVRANPTNYIAVGLITDDNLITQPQPVADFDLTVKRKVILSSIPVGTNDLITGRNIYRTEADDTQLKLLAAINNVVTTYEDIADDSTLGVNAPTVGDIVVAGVDIYAGLQGEFLYVYMGDGTQARKAAGAPATGTLTVANGSAGQTDAGVHLFAVVGETDTGYLSPPVAFKDFTTSASYSVSFSNIPLFTGDQWVKRHIVATKVITDYNGNTTGYIYYFIPNATISDNITTTLTNINFFDADLLEDASHLLDNYSEIPAGVGLIIYHNRLVLFTIYDDISICLVSAKGEPEAISQIDGMLIFPPDGNSITNAQELRDILYLMKNNRTIAFIDNEDEPATWPMTFIDQAIGTSAHGIATVIDSGSSNVDSLILASRKGIIVFNGIYNLPELSWKIRDFWLAQDKTKFHYIQLLNDTVNQILYCTLPDRRLLIGDYSNGLDPEKIRWAPWRFNVKVNTIALINVDELIIGAEASADEA